MTPSADLINLLEQPTEFQKKTFLRNVSSSQKKLNYKRMLLRNSQMKDMHKAKFVVSGVSFHALFRPTLPAPAPGLSQNLSEPHPLGA